MVTVTLDKERHLRLTLRGMLEFEKLTGKKLFKGFNPKEFALDETAALFYACLIHEDKELTYDKVLDIVDLSNINQVSDAILGCIIEAFPEHKEELIQELEKSHHPLAKSPSVG